MPLLTPEVNAWFATHHGVSRRTDLFQLGIRPTDIRYALETGVLVAVSQAVYRLAAVPPSSEQRMALACAVDDDVVISHVSAGRLWGLRRLGRDARLHVTIGGRSNRLVPGVARHRSHRVHAIDVVGRDDGIRVTSPPRTVFDLAAMLHDDALASVIEQVLHEQRCTVPTLFDTGRRLAERGRNGSARFARVLQSRPALLKPVASDLELMLEQAILDAGLPRPLRGHPVRLRSGDTVHPDFLWPEAREAVEVDHVTWHGGKLDLTYDKRRDRELWKVGVHVTRVTDSEISNHLGRVIADLRAILRPSRAA